MLCPHCNKDVSNLALSCPQCGHPIEINQKPRTTAVELLACFVMSAIIPLVGLVLGVWLWNWRKQSGAGGLCILLALFFLPILFVFVASRQ